MHSLGEQNAARLPAQLPYRLSVRAVPRHEIRKSVSARRDGQLAYAVVPAASAPPRALASRRIVREDVSDEMLLEQIGKGDKAAMHIMFARYRATVLAFVRRIVRNPAIEDDLVSQVFLDVWRSAHRFEGRAKVSTWLLSIARFKAISSLRQRQFETIDQDEVRAIPDAGDTPEGAIERKQMSGILQQCIDTLSPAHRQIVDLIYLREKSVAEVSKILRISESTVKTRMFYARKRLAKLLCGVEMQGTVECSG